MFDPLRLVLSLYIWRLSIRYMGYFDNVNRARAHLIIHLSQLFFATNFAIIFARSMSQFLSMFDIGGDWYEFTYKVMPSSFQIMYLLFGINQLLAIEVVSTAHNEQSSVHDGPMDTTN